jgi:hypothetical protein
MCVCVCVCVCVRVEVKLSKYLHKCIYPWDIFTLIHARTLPSGPSSAGSPAAEARRVVMLGGRRSVGREGREGAPRRKTLSVCLAARGAHLGVYCAQYWCLNEQECKSGRIKRLAEFWKVKGTEHEVK